MPFRGRCEPISAIFQNTQAPNEQTSRKHFIFLSPFRFIFIVILPVLFFISLHFLLPPLNHVPQLRRPPTVHSFFFIFQSPVPSTLICATQKTFKCINIHFLLRCNGFISLFVLIIRLGGGRCLVRCVVSRVSGPKWLIVFMFAVLK